MRPPDFWNGPSPTVRWMGSQSGLWSRRPFPRNGGHWLGFEPGLGTRSADRRRSIGGSVVRRPPGDYQLPLCDVDRQGSSRPEVGSNHTVVDDIRKSHGRTADVDRCSGCQCYPGHLGHVLDFPGSSNRPTFTALHLGPRGIDAERRQVAQAYRRGLTSGIELALGGLVADPEGREQVKRLPVIVVDAEWRRLSLGSALREGFRGLQGEHVGAKIN